MIFFIENNVEILHTVTAGNGISFTEVALESIDTTIGDCIHFIHIFDIKHTDKSTVNINANKKNALQENIFFKKKVLLNAGNLPFQTIYSSICHIFETMQRRVEQIFMDILTTR